MKTFVILVLSMLAASLAVADPETPIGSPLATIDLATPQGVSLVKGTWRYADAKVIETDFKAAGPDKQPTGPAVKTYDIEPHAGGRDFDDSRWTAIDPTTLDARRGNGRLAFNWYRIRVTVPERIGGFDPTGSTAVFETSVDDYAEVWVDGELARAAGQSGGSVVKGWNAANRLVVGRNVKPGQTIQLAVFGANGPLSNPPTNYIWLRYAKLEFHPGQREPYAVRPQEVNVDVLRLDPAHRSHRAAEPEDLQARGRVPVHRRSGVGAGCAGRPSALLGSEREHHLPLHRRPASSRCSGTRAGTGRRHRGIQAAGFQRAHARPPGTAHDRPARQPARGAPRAGRPRDRARRPLRGQAAQQPERPRLQVRRYASTSPIRRSACRSSATTRGRSCRSAASIGSRAGASTLVAKDLAGPNGIAFSPDEKFLYVGNWDEQRKVVMRYPVRADDTIGPGEVFFDMTSATGEDAIDGIKVDVEGNLYVSGPGGLWILSPQGRHLGTVIAPKHPHNLAWGDDDGKTLYLAAQSGLYRMRLNVPGVRP